MTERICFVGDTHGVHERMQEIVRTAAAQGARVIVQVGDFGIWPGEVEHSRPMTDGWENDVAHMLEHYGLERLYFVDGNHDWHPWLRAQLRKRGIDSTGAVPVEDSGRVLWVPRGTTIELAGVRILCCGGAPSIDPELRVQGLSWWPDEEITVEEAARAGLAGPVDVLVTHDISEWVPLPWIADRWEPGERSRRLVEQIRAATKPRWAFSGHYHRRLSAVIKDGWTPTRWELLGCESSPLTEHMVVMDAEALRKAHRVDVAA